jgi:hypothetical protein
METPYYFEIINQERRDDISKEVNASRPYFQNNHERTHKSGLVKNIVEGLGALLINAGNRLKNTTVYPEIEYSKKS